MSTRICEHCGMSNDVSRVFCMDCGTRLPEPVEAAGTSPAESPAVSSGVSAPPIPAPSYRPPLRQSTPRKAPARNSSFSGEIVLLAVLGFLLASLIQAVRTPDQVVPAIASDAGAAAKTFATVKKCAASPTLATWTINLPAINQLLASGIPANEPAGAALPPGTRAFVTIDFGSFEFFIERIIFDRPIYFSLKARPVISEGVLQAKVTGGSVGRLPVPSFLVAAILPQFQPTLKNLAPAIVLVGKAQSVSINPTDVTLQWPGSGTASP